MAPMLMHMIAFALQLLAFVHAGAVPRQLQSRDIGLDGDVKVVNEADQGGCPAVWRDIRQDLWQRFEGCSRGASFAIRFAFHDAAATSKNTPYYSPAAGGADGSLLLNDEEAARSDNNPLQAFRSNLSAVYDKYHASDKISAADLVQFAGSLGIKACAAGPVVRTVVGRKDSSNAAPKGLLPPGFGPGADAESLINLFADKGFDAQDLAALVGAHTVSQAFAAQRNGIPPGGQQDTTPTKWDTTFYKELRSPRPAPNTFEFESDVNLAAGNTTTGAFFQKFGDSKAEWDAAFVKAMEKMSLLGIPEDDRKGFLDCTAVMAG